MSVAHVAPLARSADARESRPATAPLRGKSPINAKPEVFDAWLESGLQCAAGKREFRLGRYHVAHVANGEDYARALAAFRRHVAEHSKTGFLAIFDGSQCATAEEELRLLGAAMQEARLGEAEQLISGKALSHAIDVVCPVTGRETTYEFFSVAFCRHSANSRDPLYDPSLSAPFTAINTTSDAFAFARMVHDTAVRTWGCTPYDMVADRDAVELLFRRCVVAWQNMSITTIQSYSRVAVDPSRGVHLSDDQTHWYAAHNDPVFGELQKCPYLHEMPIAYAARLTAKWSATLFDGKPYVPSRDGQSGGVAVSEREFAAEGIARELFEF